MRARAWARVRVRVRVGVRVRVRGSGVILSAPRVVLLGGVQLPHGKVPLRRWYDWMPAR